MTGMILVINDKTESTKNVVSQLSNFSVETRTTEAFRYLTKTVLI